MATAGSRCGRPGRPMRSNGISISSGRSASNRNPAGCRIRQPGPRQDRGRPPGFAHHPIPGSEPLDSRPILHHQLNEPPACIGKQPLKPGVANGFRPIEVIGDLRNNPRGSPACRGQIGADLDLIQDIEVDHARTHPPQRAVKRDSGSLSPPIEDASGCRRRGGEQRFAAPNFSPPVRNAHCAAATTEPPPSSRHPPL